MSFYECAFCHSDYPDYPKFMLNINYTVPSDQFPYKDYFSSLWESAYESVKERYPESRDILEHNLGEILLEFNDSLQNKSQWFCSKKCLEDFIKNGYRDCSDRIEWM